MERRGDWMVTFTGRQYWPLDPRAAEVCITDIAAALSKECRFGGHVSRFYSVAEHSVHVSRVVPAEHAFAALMHDATEAYVKDIPRPLKNGLGSVYADIEELNWLAICDAFKLDPVLPECVKQADNSVLMAERNALLPKNGPQWGVNVEPAKVHIAGHDPGTAAYWFLRRFYELTRDVA